MDANSIFVPQDPQSDYSSLTTRAMVTGGEVDDTHFQSLSPAVTGDGSSPEIYSDADLGSDSVRFAAAIVGDQIGNNSTPYYFGDKQGIAFLLDICKPNYPPRGGHVLIPRPVTKPQQPEDLAYLWAKGAFSVPSENVCQSLLQCYFRYVHPLLPVIDAAGFIADYTRGGPKGVSSFLLCSMFSVASNFVEPVTLHLAGFSTRKEMKQSMYQKAKALYDCNVEEDKIVLIQSVILLAFWYPEVEDRSGSWHWIGVAVSLCQAIGLNRKPDRSRINPHMSDGQRRLWRRIWWNCFVRDRWISFILGRPLRINLDDCDVPTPSTEDVLAEMKEISTTEKETYHLSDSYDQAQCWVNLVHLSIILGKILKINSEPAGGLPTAADIERCRKELVECLITGQNGTDQRTQIDEFYLNLLQLHYESVMIALYRPHILIEVINAPGTPDETRTSEPHLAVSNATSNTHGILNRIVTENMVQFLGPMTLTALVPAMHIHLLELQSSRPLRRRLGLHKLNFLLAIMAELAETYSSADLIHKLFKEGQKKLATEYGHQSMRADINHAPVSREDFVSSSNISLNSNIGDVLDSHSPAIPREDCSTEDADYIDLNTMLSTQDFMTLVGNVQ